MNRARRAFRQMDWSPRDALADHRQDVLDSAKFYRMVDELGHCDARGFPRLCDSCLEL